MLNYTFGIYIFYSQGAACAAVISALVGLFLSCFMVAYIWMDTAGTSPPIPTIPGKRPTAASTLVREFLPLPLLPLFS
jgi:hypothetical protein